MNNHPRHNKKQTVLKTNQLSTQNSPKPGLTQQSCDTMNIFQNMDVFKSAQDDHSVGDKHVSVKCPCDKTKENLEKKKLLHRTAPVAAKKRESGSRKGKKRAERGVSEAVDFKTEEDPKPHFSLLDAAEDFPTLNSVRKNKSFRKPQENSGCFSFNADEYNILPENSKSTLLPVKSWKPKKKDPICISLETALQNKPLQEKTKTAPGAKKSDAKTFHKIQVGNILDSDSPQQKRGKVRPDKKKKPTKLKSQILQERIEKLQIKEEFQAQQLKKEDCSDLNSEQILGPLIKGFEDEMSFLLENCTFLGINNTSVSTHNEKLDCDISLKDEQAFNRRKFHSRRFREYCTNWLTEELISSVCSLLEKIAQFQDRTFAQNPIKASAKRRYVAGIGQTNKYLRVKKVKLLVIAPDLERNSKEGGLDEKINYFINEAENQGIPSVFGPNRKQLGRAVSKKVYVSCVAILNYEGAEEKFAKVLQELQDSQKKYQSVTGYIPESVGKDLDNEASKELENEANYVSSNSLDEISLSILATLREDLTPAEKLMRAIEHKRDTF